MAEAPPRQDITGLVLAGGQGSRMGGLDKGLQVLHGRPLVLHALERLASQVGPVLVSANRHLPEYEALGVSVCRDAQPGFVGPLAGMLAGLSACRTPWLATVPCDTPGFPADLVARLAAGVADADAELALAGAPENGVLRAQPVFCLLRRSLAGSLAAYLAGGGRQVQAWMGQHRTVQVAFDRPGDAPNAFFNVNTLAQLRQLEHS